MYLDSSIYRRFRSMLMASRLERSSIEAQIRHKITSASESTEKYGFSLFLKFEIILGWSCFCGLCQQAIMWLPPSSTITTTTYSHYQIINICLHFLKCRFWYIHTVCTGFTVLTSLFNMLKWAINVCDIEIRIKRKYLRSTNINQLTFLLQNELCISVVARFNECKALS